MFINKERLVFYYFVEWWIYSGIYLYFEARFGSDNYWWLYFVLGSVGHGKNKTVYIVCDSEDWKEYYYIENWEWWDFWVWGGCGGIGEQKICEKKKNLFCFFFPLKKVRKKLLKRKNSHIVWL